MKIIIANNFVIPYRTYFFNALFHKYSKELSGSKVIYLTKKESIRQFKDNNDSLFDDYILPVIYQKRNNKTTTSDYIINYGYLRFLKKADIFFSMGYSYSTYLIMAFFSRVLGIKTVCFCETNTYDNKRYSFKSFLKKIILNLLYDKFFVPGVEARKYLLELGISNNKIKIVGNSAPFSEANKYNLLSNDSISKDKVSVLYVGRISHEKNIISTLKNMEKLSKSINITIVGDGPLFDDLISLTSCSKHQYKVMKFIDRELLPTVYKKNDLLILPSLSESWGLVVNEAISFGLGILVSNNVGCGRDLVKENGYIYKVDDESDFLKKMELLILNINFYKKASLQMREDISVERNVDLVYEGLKELYEENI
ncbi:glycosyltransferase family 4 protein [Edwardsiella tarda]